MAEDGRATIEDAGSGAVGAAPAAAVESLPPVADWEVGRSPDDALQLVAIALVTGGPEFGAEIMSILATNYSVTVYDDVAKALDGLAQSPPLALIIENELGKTGAQKFLARVREVPALQSVPTLIIIDQHNAAFALKTDYLEGSDYLIKPVEAATLLPKVSAIVNAAVEKSWDALPPLQKTVLNETTSIFRNCFNSIQAHEPIPVKHIEDSCRPLVAAVTDHQVTGLLQSVQNHDDYTYVHSLRVAIYLTLLGDALGMAGDDLLTLSSGGLMHDLGKSSVPHEVLNKPDRLTASEFEVIKLHVDHTRDIFDSADNISIGIQTIALQHHEKLDGSGYPLGLKGAELNELARMAAIVDIFSALTDRRVYKPAMPAEKALGIMEGMKDGLDQHFIGQFKTFLLDAGGLPE